TLSVVLESPDPDLPSVLADPIFSPVFDDGTQFNGPPESIVTNGPFRITSSGTDALVLAKSDTYYDKDTVKLDSVKLIPTQSAEDALSAYRAGQLDVVTNTELEPAALKLLTPYEDFRKATNGALNMYEFNLSRPPFDDERVRKALAISIERERLTDGELEGTTRPALRYLPFGGKQVEPLAQDADAARDLLTDAGFPNGQGFPIIRLVVNRNDTQQRIARAVARMWKQNLNIDTEVIAKDATDVPAVRASGDYDLLRKGIVFPTADPQTNIASVLSSHPTPEPQAENFAPHKGPSADSNTLSRPEEQHPYANANLEHPSAKIPPTEEDALYELPAIPLYFPTSYSLVKPYVHGFEPNGLDLFLLDQISIDNSWQPKAAGSES
ncbi:MAG TPA: ABC transporter substrate-binding protein, partial [Pyrinomonadaceae bacterium]